MDELPEGMDKDERELCLKLRAMGQPYIDQMNTDPFNVIRRYALQSELDEKVRAIIWEYELRKYLPDCNLPRLSK